MLLDQISGPDDLRGLDARQLDTLCEEIRTVIIDAVSSHSGHLGSNLGIAQDGDGSYCRL